MAADRPVTARRAAPLAVLGIAGLVVAVLTYRPDRALPFDILDFSEFLPVLRRSSSFWTGSWDLATYYATQGRANLVPYVLMSLKWSWFADWSPGWQWSRFFAMTGCVILAFRLLSRLGATRLGAVLGASLFVAAPAAARGWIRLTMAEPLGTLLLLFLCLAVLPRPDVGRQSGRATVVVALIALTLLTKEMLVVTLALPAALLCVIGGDGRLSRPAVRPAAVRFAVQAALVSAAVLAPLFLLVRRAPREAFSAQFGASWRSPGDTAASWLATLVPFDPARALPPALVGAALGLLVALVAAGWWLWISRSEAPGARGALLGIGLLFPLAGALAYMPWSAWQPFYAIPYLLGTAIIIALAVSGLESRGRVAAWLGAGGFGVLLLAGLVDGQAQAGRAAASQRVHHRLVERVAALEGVDAVLVASDRTAPQDWQGLGPTLARYAAATGHPWPPTRDVPCTRTGGTTLGPGSRSLSLAWPGNYFEVSPRKRGPSAVVGTAQGLVVVYYSSLCPRSSDPDAIVEYYRRLDLATLTVARDSLRVDVELRAHDEPGAR